MNIFTRIIAVATFAVAAIGVTTPSEAGFFTSFKPKPSLVATVSLSEQRMYLKVTDERGKTQKYVWKVSTGTSGFDTPRGQFRPTWLSKDHKSSQYDDAPMPYSVFFVNGVAIHGTEAVSKLGSRASHGCVRLATENAEAFYNAVQAYGKYNTKIIVTN